MLWRQIVAMREGAHATPGVQIVRMGTVTGRELATFIVEDGGVGSGGGLPAFMTDLRRDVASLCGKV
jgi:hypothetical protein